MIKSAWSLVGIKLGIHDPENCNRFNSSAEAEEQADDKSATGKQHLGGYDQTTDMVCAQDPAIPGCTERTTVGLASWSLLFREEHAGDFAFCWVRRLQR